MEQNTLILYIFKNKIIFKFFFYLFFFAIIKRYILRENNAKAFLLRSHSAREKKPLFVFYLPNN